MSSTSPQRLSTSANYISFLNGVDNFMFDCDGVLWRGDDLVPGALEALAYLRSQNKNIIFVTNNATKSRKKLKRKFDKLGIQAEVDEIFGSAYASAVYISSVIKLPKDQKVYVIGMAGLEEELAGQGISYIGGTDPADNTLTPPFSISKFTLDPSVSIVLAGADVNMNFTKQSKAHQFLTRNPGCKFIVTNEDSTHPAGAGGGTLPGAGCIGAMLKYSTKMEPIAIGKPNAAMMDTVKAKHHFDPSRTVMVGDRLDTDILFGKNRGCKTLLVLTGVANEKDLIADPPAVPDFIIDSIGNLAVLKIN